MEHTPEQTTKVDRRKFLTMAGAAGIAAAAGSLGHRAAASGVTDSIYGNVYGSVYGDVYGGFHGDPQPIRQIALDVVQEYVQTYAMNVRSFGAVGDGVADDTDAIQEAMEYCIEHEIELMIPQGTFMVRAGALFIHIYSGKNLVVRGTGVHSVIKVFDGEINARFKEVFKIQSDSHVKYIVFRDLHIDNNARGSLPPATPYGYEQSHTFRILVSAGNSLENILFDHVTIHDPAADGFCNASNGVKHFRVTNCSVTGRTRVRSDIQMSRMPQQLIVSGFTGSTIEAEDINKLDGFATSFILSDSVVETLDLLPGYFSTSVLNNVRVTHNTNLGYHKTLVSNCVLNLGVGSKNGRWDNLFNGSKFTNTDIRLTYDTVENAVIGLDLFNNSSDAVPFDRDVSFEHCNFLIDHEGDISPTGFLLKGSVAWRQDSLYPNKKSVVGCLFDRRCSSSISCHRNGFWFLKDNRYGGRDYALQLSSTSGFYSNTVIDGGDFSDVEGVGFALSGHAYFEAFLMGTMIGETALRFTNLSGSATNARIRSNRFVFVDSLPISAFKGDTIILNNVALGAVTEYESVSTSPSAPILVMKRQSGVLNGSSAERPTLSARDKGYLYFDQTLASSGQPIWWNGTNWVDAEGAVV